MAEAAAQSPASDSPSSENPSPQGAADSKAGSNTWVLQLHSYRKQWKGRSGVSDQDFIVEFLFTVTPVEGGRAVGDSEAFWCEVQLKDNLRTRPGWKSLSEEDTVRAMYCYAVDAIRRSGGRPRRHLPMSWIAGQPWAEAPHWDLSGVDLKSPKEVEIDTREAVIPVVVHQH